MSTVRVTVAHDSVKVGQTFTISGRYKRRTFWQWILRRPRELQQFRAKRVSSTTVTYVPDTTRMWRLFDATFREFDRIIRQVRHPF